MFNKDFYPTPIAVMDMMQLDLEGAIILEPSAGSGNMIDTFHRLGCMRIWTLKAHNNKSKQKLL